MYLNYLWIKWNSKLFINFLNHQKAFEIIDTDTLRKTLRKHGIPEKFLDLIKSMYVNNLQDCEWRPHCGTLWYQNRCHTKMFVLSCPVYLNNYLIYEGSYKGRKKWHLMDCMGTVRGTGFCALFTHPRTHESGSSNSQQTIKAYWIENPF